MGGGGRGGSQAPQKHVLFGGVITGGGGGGGGVSTCSCCFEQQKTPEQSWRGKFTSQLLVILLFKQLLPMLEAKFDELLLLHRLGTQTELQISLAATCTGTATGTIIVSCLLLLEDGAARIIVFLFEFPQFPQQQQPFDWSPLVLLGGDGGVFEPLAASTVANQRRLLPSIISILGGCFRIVVGF